MTFNYDYSKHVGQAQEPDKIPPRPKPDKKAKKVKIPLFKKPPKDEKLKKDSIDFSKLDYENLTPEQSQKLIDQINQIDP